MIQNQQQDASKDESKLSSVHLRIYINEQIQVQDFPEFQKYASQTKDKLIEFSLERLEDQNQLFITMKYNPSRESNHQINKIIEFFKRNIKNQSTFDKVELDIYIQKANISNLQMLHKTLEKILHDVTKFKLVCDSEINEKQLKQLILTLNQLMTVESFQFICKEKLLLKEQDLDIQFIEEIQRIVINTKTFIFNNSLEKGYNSSEICTIPGLLSQSIVNAQNLLNLEINFHNAGWIYRNRSIIILSKFLDNFTLYLKQWPTQLQVINIDFDRLICFNSNFNPIHIQRFLIEFANMLSKQNNLRELGLNLQGIGYKCGQIEFNNFRELCWITQSIKTVKVLKLLIGGKIELCESDWRKFFEGICSINNLQDLELNVECWSLFVSNITDQQQYNIIDTFLSDLLKNHKTNLQRLILNIDNWKFLFQVNILDLLQRISKFENLISFQLLNSKTKNLEQFSLIKQAEFYYNTLQNYTKNIIIVQNTLKKSKILSIMNETLTKNYYETIQNVYKNLATQQLFKEDKYLRTSKIKTTSDFIIRCIQSILNVQHYFQIDVQENLYNISLVPELISQISLEQKQNIPQTCNQEKQDYELID
ncbi:hypothetical protein ABPG72_000571 [Tetrahymena utriculariae]